MDWLEPAYLFLQNGRKLWIAMWEYRHPDVPCFLAQVTKRIQKVLEKEYTYRKAHATPLPPLPLSR